MLFKKIVFLSIFLSFTAFSQEIAIPIDTTITTQHSINIQSKKIDYTATTGTQPVWNSEHKAIAREVRL